MSVARRIVRPMSRLPRVLVVPYLAGWSYDHTARAIREHLSHRFDISLAYTADVEQQNLDERFRPDVVIDMWWHGTLHYEFGTRTLKQISSHRWRMPKWGRLKPSNMLRRYASGAGAIVVPSQRLFHLLGQVEDVDDPTRVFTLGPKGFDPKRFADRGERRGELVVGWAGDSAAPDKHVRDIVEAEPRAVLADKCLTYGEMPDFYNGIDIIAIASSDEGDPRPLIEGMACGCFVVATDVGIVPELVRHGVNGLIIDRSPDAFRAAFAWCRDNIDYVRRAGAENARFMLERRTWAHVMPRWGDAIDLVLSRSGRPRRETETETGTIIVDEGARRYLEDV